MIRKGVILAPFALALCGCMSMGSDGPPASGGNAPEPMRPPPGQCNAGAVQSYVGQTASTDVGAAILAASGARGLRWGPPNSAWTMDYREDRVNVRYDADMKITAVTCG